MSERWFSILQGLGSGDAAIRGTLHHFDESVAGS